jgi:hypothetical protein
MGVGVERDPALVGDRGLDAVDVAGRMAEQDILPRGQGRGAPVERGEGGAASARAMDSSRATRSG